MDTAQVKGIAPDSTRARDTMIDELYEHGPLLLAAARVITLDHDEAQDLVQATFEIALRHGRSAGARDRAPRRRQPVAIANLSGSGRLPAPSGGEVKAPTPTP